MTEYYENGPEGMPRVERMTRSTIMAVLSQKDVPTIYVSREEDYNSLCKFAHAVAEETLARVPAWPVERTTAPVSLTDEQAWTIITEICGTQLTRVGSRKFQVVEINDMATAGEVARALLAAAPAPIQQEPKATLICPTCGKDRFKEPCPNMPDECSMVADAHLLAPPALAGSQVQAAGDAVVDDLAMLVRRLVRSLEKANPGTDLAPQALDYLKRKGLQGSPLREQQP